MIIRIFMHKKVTFSWLKVTFTILKTTFSQGNGHGVWGKEQGA